MAVKVLIKRRVSQDKAKALIPLVRQMRRVRRMEHPDRGSVDADQCAGPRRHEGRQGTPSELRDPERQER